MNTTTDGGKLIVFNNPRKFAEFGDWPCGRHWCKCRFEVESNSRGERVLRFTENKARTGWNKPKKTTYADAFVIVDGDDGKTYLLSYNSICGRPIIVWFSDLQHVTETFWPKHPLYLELLRLFKPEARRRDDEN